MSSKPDTQAVQSRALRGRRKPVFVKSEQVPCTFAGQTRSTSPSAGCPEEKAAIHVDFTHIRLASLVDLFYLKVLSPWLLWRAGGGSSSYVRVCRVFLLVKRGINVEVASPSVHAPITLSTASSQTLLAHRALFHSYKLNLFSSPYNIIARPSCPATFLAK